MYLYIILSLVIISSNHTVLPGNRDFETVNAVLQIPHGQKFRLLWLGYLNIKTSVLWLGSYNNHFLVQSYSML